MSLQLDLVNLPAQLNDYYRENRGVIAKLNLLKLFGTGALDLMERYSILDLVEDEVLLDANYVSDFIHQQVPSLPTTFNPDGMITPIPRVLKARKFEGDMAFRDDELQTTYKMFYAQMQALCKLHNDDPAYREKSFIDYLFADLILDRASDNLRRALFQAKWDNTAPFAWNKILDGVLTVLDNEIALGTIVPVGIPTPDPTNVITSVESVFDTLGPGERFAGDLQCEVSETVYRNLVRANVASLGRSDQYNAPLDLTIKGYGTCKIYVEPAFTKNQILVTRKSNKFIGLQVSRNEGIASMEFQRYERTTKMMLNGKIGFNFAMVNPDPSNPNVAFGA